MYFSEGLKFWFGEDKFYWFLPTKPVLYVNYLERLFEEDILENAKTREEIQSDDYDP